MMVVDGATGKVLGDIPNTPGVHGAGIATKAGHGFTTNSGDQTVTMFDLKTLAVIKQIKVGPGLDGIMYDEPDDKIILTNHSRPIGTLTAINPEIGRHRRHGRTRGHRARRRRGRRQRAHLRQQRRQEHDPGDRRQDVEGDGVVAARARATGRPASPTTRRPTASSPAATRPRSSSMRTTGKVVADDRERHARRRARLGSSQEADLHSERRRRQRHRRRTRIQRTNTPWWRPFRRSRARRRSRSIRRRTTSICSSRSAVRRRLRPPMRRRRRPEEAAAADRKGPSSRRGLSRSDPEGEWLEGTEGEEDSVPSWLLTNYCPPVFCATAVAAAAVASVAGYAKTNCLNSGCRKSAPNLYCFISWNARSAVHLSCVIR